MKPEEEIEDTLQKIQDILENPKIDWTYKNNPAIKEGYEEAVNILADDRKTYAGLNVLKTTQGKAIAVLAVDYLNGLIQAHILLDVPIQYKLEQMLK